MIVKRMGCTPVGVPDFYQIHLKWLKRADDSKDNFAMTEAIRFARLAEEFGQAEVIDDETEEV